MLITELYQHFLSHQSVQTDTRKLKPGELFFALKGPNFNANNFAQQALDKGAAFAVVDDYYGPPDNRIIRVDDVLFCLQQLAKHHRLQFNIPFIAITGSNGKTTTKELLHQVMSSTFKTYATQGNLNNHIGIPLTLLNIKADAEIALIEMGANHQHEIEAYCRYTLPTHGIITNCGKAHLEGFGGIDGVRKGKGELYDHLRVNNGTAFIMWDYDYLRNMSTGIPVIKTYGTHDAEITGKVKNSSGFLEINITKGAGLEIIETQLIGDYNLPNVLAALTIGKYFNVTEDKIKSALENYIPSNSRSQLILKEGNRILLDTYNANPTSMKAAIENFAKMNGSNKILMLGGMMELGSESIAEHQSIIRLISGFKWKDVVLVGGDFLNIQHPYISFENSIQAREWLQGQHFTDSQLLIKGSRSTEMEKVLG